MNVNQKTSTNKNVSILILLVHQLSAKIASGGERMFLEVSKRFSERGVSVRAVIPEIVAKDARDFGLQYPFYFVPCFAFERKGYLDSLGDMFSMFFVFVYRTFYALIHIRGWLKEYQANVVYSTGDFIPDTVPAVFAKICSKRDITWVALIHHIIMPPWQRHASGILSKTISFAMQRFSFYLIKKYADCVFVKNAEVREQLKWQHFNVEKVHIVDNGVDIHKIEALQTIGDNQFDASYIGRLSASKGITDLVQVWSKVLEVLPEARLAIIGGGSTVKLEEYRHNLMQNRKVAEKVCFLGELSDQDAYAIRKSSKIFLSCSYEEGWGISIAESLACGIPCVGYDLPVYHEKFENALTVVPIGDVDGFANATISLLKDPVKRKNLCVLGKQVVLQYDIEHIVDRELEIIRNISFEGCQTVRG